MSYSLWDWWNTKEEKPENGLKAAVEQNKVAARETIQGIRKTRSQTQRLLRTAEESLAILERAEKREK